MSPLSALKPFFWTTAEASFLQLTRDRRKGNKERGECREGTSDANESLWKERELGRFRIETCQKEQIQLTAGFYITHYVFTLTVKTTYVQRKNYRNLMFHCKERTVFLTVVDVLNDQMTEHAKRTGRHYSLARSSLIIPRLHFTSRKDMQEESEIFRFFGCPLSLFNL